MSFINKNTGSHVYAPGWFLASEEGVRFETRTIPATGASTDGNGGKYVKMGTIFPANDATAEGFVFEDVYVDSGNMPGSVVTSGVVYLDRLPVTIESAAQTALEGKGFKFIETSPAVTRPY